MIETLKSLILGHLEISNGIRDKDMVLKLMGLLQPTAFTAEEFLTAVNQLIIEREIYHLCFLDQTSHISTTILFRKDTRLLEVNIGQDPFDNEAKVAPESH